VRPKPGKACEACAKAHAKCTTAESDREVSLGVEEICLGVRKELRAEVSPLLRALKQEMRVLGTEVWALSKGAGGSGDAEWADQVEALQNWALWGKAGTGFGHLPEINPEDLRRSETDSEGESEEKEMDVDEEGSSEEEKSSEEEEEEEEEVAGREVKDLLADEEMV
jgi:hypothetical protein